MSKKLTLSISNITLTIEHAGGNSLGDALAQALGGLAGASVEVHHFGADETNGKDAPTDTAAASTEAPAQAASEPAAAPAEPAITRPSTEQIVAFLRSKPEFRFRTFDAIKKAFPAADEGLLRRDLDELVDEGDIGTKTRRADRATLYYATLYYAY